VNTPAARVGRAEGNAGLRSNDAPRVILIIAPPSVRCIVGADSTMGSAMPTAPTFSKRFYDKFGPENITELANWLNQMDLTYRSQLHELNELNFARFDAKLEQRIAEVKAELREEMADLKTELLQAVSEMGSALRQEMAQANADLRKEMAQGNADLRKEISASNSRLIRWMFVFWTGTTVTLLGAMFAITRL
jgi:hypothetical protein